MSPKEQDTEVFDRLLHSPPHPDHFCSPGALGRKALSSDAASASFLAEAVLQISPHWEIITVIDLTFEKETLDLLSGSWEIQYSNKIV